MAKAKEPQHSEAEKEATRLATLMGSSIYQAGQTHQFQNRGFSERTIKALAKSVDAPERLLFMAEHEIRENPRDWRSVGSRNSFVPRKISPWRAVMLPRQRPHQCPRRTKAAGSGERASNYDLDQCVDSAGCGQLL
jgi:hypothetical protein